MIHRRSIIGLCLLCALGISAIAARSASAALSGTTAFTCAPVTPKAETKGFSDAHCKGAVSTNANFEHVAIANDTTTELNVSNGTTGATTAPFILTATVAGATLELEGSKVSGTGTIHNQLEGEEHQATGTAQLKFEGVKVKKPLTGEGVPKCVVKTDNVGVKGAEGVIDGTFIATTKGQGDGLKFEPDKASLDEPFATFWIEQNPATAEKCPAALVKKWEIIGSVKATTIEGATFSFTIADTQTTQGTLRVGSTEGPKAGIAGTITLSARANSGEAYKPLSLTTTPPPPSTGTTAFTCAPVTPKAETKGFSDAHCKSAVTTNANFEHVAIANDETTELNVSNSTTGGASAPFLLTATVAGATLEMEASKVSGTGTIHNQVDVEEHQATGTATLEFKEVLVKKPVTPGGVPKCVVKTDNAGVPGAEGVIDGSLVWTTKGQGDGLKFEPDKASPDEPIANFWLEQNPATAEKCPPTLVKKWDIIGSIKATTIEGATFAFTIADTQTTQGTLRVGSTSGPKAGIEGTITLSARANSGEAYKPLSLTTT
jgi:hypothetical protein